MALLRALVAELVGTALYVFVAVTALVSNAKVERADSSLLGVALATGLVVTASTAAFFPASGAHFNPAVTLAHLLRRRLPPLVAVLHVAAQLAGAALALGVCRLGMDAFHLQALGHALPRLGAHVSPLNGMIFEGLLTALLVSVALRLSSEDRRGIALALGVGTVYALGVLSAGPFTGGSLNPARYFGSALSSGRWDDATVYLLAPCLGAVGAVVLDRLLTGPVPRAEK